MYEHGSFRCQLEIKLIKLNSFWFYNSCKFCILETVIDPIKFTIHFYKLVIRLHIQCYLCAHSSYGSTPHILWLIKAQKMDMLSLNFFFFIMEERKEEWRIIKNLKLKRSIYSDTGKIRIVPCKEYIYFNISMGL